jgi:hypothetical protein
VSLGTAIVVWLGRKRILHKGCGDDEVAVWATKCFVLLTPTTSSVARRTITSIQENRADRKLERSVEVVSEGDDTAGLVAGTETGSAAEFCLRLGSKTGT